MSRIRSIHPGLFTDEAFMALSAHARLLVVGVWTEAFDDGVFEWKPLTLKAKIFPADNVDVPGLLAELIAGAFVRREEADGRQIGLIRNFRVYQRPKKPNSSGMLRDEWRTYVGISDDSGEPVPNQSATSGGKSPQMEDGGGRREDGDTSPPPVPEPEGARVSFEDVVEAYPRDPGPKEPLARKAFASIVAADLPLVLAGAIYTSKALAEDSVKRGRSIEQGAQYVTELHNFLKNGEWRGAAALAAKDQPSPDLEVIDVGSADFEALKKLRAPKPIYVPDSGKLTVTKAELEQARAGALH
jgi:hypothetical protein